MPTYERATVVDAPLDRVWEFHSTADGLQAITPRWFDLRVERVTGPDGTSDPEVLTAGSTIDVSIRPFGVGPRQRWTSEITHRERRDDRALFRDRMREGPFEHWLHTHQFFAVEGGTEIRDTVGYAVARGPIGRIAGVAGLVGLDAAFRYRHRRTAALLERNPVE